MSTITITSDVKAAVMAGASKADGFGKTKGGGLGVEFDGLRVSSSSERVFGLTFLLVEFLRKGVVVGSISAIANVSGGDTVQLTGVEGMVELKIS